MSSLLTLIQDMILGDVSTHGSMFVPIILGSDKTTVSVATGQNEYYPLYLSIGNVQNHMRREQTLTHGSIANILLLIKPFMTTPDIVRCPDQYFHRVLYSLGPHISDYPEQVMVVWILLNWCPTCVTSCAHSFST